MRNQSGRISSSNLARQFLTPATLIRIRITMSFYFAIIGTQDNPLFEHEFGTSRQGGDGVAKFPEQARHMNQFIVHSSLDIVEEVQWGSGQMYGFSSSMIFKLTVSCRYLKCIDRFYNNYISCFVTGGSESQSLQVYLMMATQPT